MSPSPAEAQATLARRLLNGIGLGAGISVNAGDVLTVMGGKTVRVLAQIEYRGPAGFATLYAAIGNRGLISFDEIWAGQAAPVDVGPDIDWTVYALAVDIVTDTGKSGLYDIYAKITETSAPGMPEETDVIQVVGASEFQNLAINSYIVID